MVVRNEDVIGYNGKAQTFVLSGPLHNTALPLSEFELGKDLDF